MMSTVPTEVAPPPTTPATPEPPPAQQEMTLLRDFCNQPGCGGYKSDSKKIELLTTFIWLRQLTEGLTFEVFLQKFAVVADYSEANRKHPIDALKHYCPRQKKAADTLQLPQWNAKECVDILALYVELLGFVDADPDVPQDAVATIAQYLRSDGAAYKAGEIQPPMAIPKAATKRRANTGVPAPADPDTGLVPTGKPILPSEPGQRVIYTMPHQGGRQIKGVVINLVSAMVTDEAAQQTERWYVNFTSDAGEKIMGRNIEHFAVVDELPPEPTPAANVIERKRLWIPKTTYPQVVAALALTTPMGNVNVGDVIYPFTMDMATTIEGRAMIIDVNVINGEQGPYVEAELCDPEADVSLDHLDPRDNILGEYEFVFGEGVIQLEVMARE